MSAYKLIEIQRTEEKETQSIYDKEVLSDAINTMHNDFGVMVKDESVIGAYCVIIDNTTGVEAGRLHWGTIIRDRVYTHNDYADDNITAYDSEKLAIGNYHTKLASQRNKTECNFAITARLDGVGEFADYDVWHRE